MKVSLRKSNDNTLYKEDFCFKAKLALRIAPISSIQSLKSRIQSHRKPRHVFFAICDHFEPYWGRVSHDKALSRVKKFESEFTKVAFNHRDHDGHMPVITAFYPHEEYRRSILDILTDMSGRGVTETEIHLHHDMDSSQNLTNTLIDYKNLLSSQHQLLSTDSTSGNIAYGFIHGNWALDNSGVNGRWCGVNDEITILQNTGCYADFTMPSAPHRSQTRIINSIYYAIDDPLQPKSHDTGIHASYGCKQTKGLLMVQGPLTIRLNGLLPAIENAEISSDNLPSTSRIDSWIRQGIGIKGKPDWVFCKIHTHGMQDQILTKMFNHGWLNNMLSYLESNYNDGERYILHYVSARELVNVIHALESGHGEWKTDLKGYRYKTCFSSNR